MHQRAHAARMIDQRAKILAGALPVRSFQQQTVQPRLDQLFV
jgi:hypothetical protein